MWPITDPIEAVQQYNTRAECGCWYKVSAWTLVGAVNEQARVDVDINISPYRMQRCFRHMKIGDEEVVDGIVEEMKIKLSTSKDLSVENSGERKNFPLTP